MFYLEVPGLNNQLQLPIPASCQCMCWEVMVTDGSGRWVPAIRMGGRQISTLAPAWDGVLLQPLKALKNKKMICFSKNKQKYWKKKKKTADWALFFLKKIFIGKSGLQRGRDKESLVHFPKWT